jgi:glycosyltransferase involved in cell wall biosynthesis
MTTEIYRVAGSTVLRSAVGRRRSRTDVCLILEGTYPYRTGGVSAWVQTLLTGLPDLTFAVVHLRAGDQGSREFRYPPPPNLVEFVEWPLDVSVGRDGTSPDTALLPQAQVYHALSTGFAGLLGCQMKAATGRPLILTEHGIYWREVQAGASELECGFRVVPKGQDGAVLEPLRHHWTVRLRELARLAYQEADAITTVCQANVRWQMRLGAPPTRCYVIHNGVDWQAWAPEELRAPILRPASSRHGPQGGAADGRPPRRSVAGSLWHGPETGHSGGASPSLRPVSDHASSLWHGPETGHSEAGSLWHGPETGHSGGASPLLRPVSDHASAAPWPTIRTRPPATELHREDGVWHIGFVGRVVSIKDVVTFLAACRQVAGELPGARFYVIGPLDHDPAYAARCQALVAEWGLKRRVTFTGEVDPRPWYRRLDLVVLTSLSEGQPLVLLEAMAAGVPVVATAVGGCPELILGATAEDRALGSSGLLTPVRNPQATARAILSLCRNPVQWRRASWIGQERVRRFYSARRMCEAYRALYTRFLTKQRSVTRET